MIAFRDALEKEQTKFDNLFLGECKGKQYQYKKKFMGVHRNCP